jgi:hypothetical protein
MDLLRVPPRFTLSSRLAPFSSAETSFLRPECYRAEGSASTSQAGHVRGICLGIAHFDLVIPLPDEGRERGLFFRRRRTCLCSAWAVDVPCTLPDNDHRIGCGKVFAVEMLHTSQM